MIPKSTEKSAKDKQAEIDKNLFGTNIVVGFWEYSYPGSDTLAIRISLPQLLIEDLKDHGHIIIESGKSYDSRVGGPHWSLNIPMSRWHDDAVFAETRWSGSAQVENDDTDTRWWDLPPRQTAIERYFGVPAGTFKEGK